MKDEHTEVIIEVDGADKVYFNTEFGWATKLSLTLDSVNIDDARANVINLLSGIELRPAYNDAANEEHLEPAESQLKDVTDQVSMGSYRIYSITTLIVKIDFIPSYIVDFGDSTDL